MDVDSETGHLGARRRVLHGAVGVATLVVALTATGCATQDPALDGVDGVGTLREFSDEHFVVLPETVPDRLTAVDAYLAEGVSYYEFSRDDGLAVAVCVGSQAQCVPVVDGAMVREGEADGLSFTVWVLGPSDDLPADAQTYWDTVVMSSAPGWLG